MLRPRGGTFLWSYKDAGAPPGGVFSNATQRSLGLPVASSTTGRQLFEASGPSDPRSRPVFHLSPHPSTCPSLRELSSPCLPNWP